MASLGTRRVGSFASTLVAAALVVARSNDAHAGEPPAAPEGTEGTEGRELPATAEPGAAPKSIVVWPTLTPAGDDAAQAGLHKASPAEGTLAARTQELDVTLRDAVQDLGFTLDVADQGPTLARTRDLDLIDRAAKSSARGGPQDPGTWVVSARLEPAGGDTFLLRIVAVPPRSKQLRVRVEKVSSADLSVRGLVMLRDLLAAPSGSTGETGPRPQESSGSGLMPPLRSQGRAVLAANAALFGAFTAYSVQRASGSEDPRLLYPLLALGTGIGLGGALLVAEEWDVGTGDAWLLAGAGWWGAASGVLIANGRHVDPLTDRYAWGVSGGLIGLSLGTLALTRGKADEGDAVLVTSGATLGLGVGALAELFYVGDIESRTPYTGAGYGTAIGLIAGGTLATFVQVSASRVMLVDLGAGLGAVAGAALASPLVFENVTPDKTRGFIGATAGGLVLGGSIAWLLTRERAPEPTPAHAARAPELTPFGGTIGSSATREGSVPAYGMGLRGTW